MTLYPTGTCFDDAIDIAREMLKEKPELFQSDHLFIVHAVCVSQGGVLWAHAWVEDRINDVDCVLWYSMKDGEKICLCTDRQDHYEFHRPCVVIRYTLKQAWEENLKSGHSGPWEPQIKERCAKPGDGGKPIDTMQVIPMGESTI